MVHRSGTRKGSPLTSTSKASCETAGGGAEGSLTKSIVALRPPGG